jgi:ribonuclease D
MNKLPAGVKESISKEELNEMPLKQFEGDIVLVETATMAQIAYNYLQHFPVIGFDTETKPSFKKGDNHKVALLQLATHERAFLIRIQKVGLPAEFIKLLGNPRILKPGVALRDDLKALQKIGHFTPAGFVELQDDAKSLGIKDFSLKKLCALTLDFRISKSQQLSNWESEELTDQQMVYAATDAWATLLIYEKIQHFLHG